MKKVYIYKKFERFWHWTQAALIIFLALTGFEVHNSFTIFGFEQAVFYHRIASYMLLILIAFAIFWHFTTGEWKQYVPTTKKLKEQIRYYTKGIFKGEPHPTKKTTLSKLNPLQILTYLAFKVILVPLIVISGLMYMFYKTIDKNDVVIISGYELKTVAIVHTVGAFLLITFLIVHVYMTTTGHTPTSNIKAMITGFENLEEEDKENSETENKKNSITEK